MSLKNRLLHILPNIRLMLTHRGYNNDTIISTEASPHLIYKIDQFISLTLEDNYKSFLDIFVHNSTGRDFVRFLKDEKPIDKIFEKEMNDIITIYGLSKNDNISFIMVDKEFSDEERIKLNIIESNFPMVRIFSYTNFAIDIGSHVLVPKHIKFTGDTNILKKNLMIDSLNKLPCILHTDPMSRLLNLRNNDVVEIKRNTTVKDLRMYRICKDENFTPVRRKIKVTKSKTLKSSKKEKEVTEVTEVKEVKEKSVDTSISPKQKIKRKIKRKIKPNPPKAVTRMTSEELDEKEEEVKDQEEIKQVFWDDSKDIQFYSRSVPLKEAMMKTVSLKYLSNFQRIIGNSVENDEDILGIIDNIDIDNFDGLTIEGKQYSTIEHYFQSKKYNGKYHLNLTKENKTLLKSIHSKFQKDAAYDNPLSKIYSKKNITPGTWGIMAQSIDRALRKKYPDLEFNSDKWNIDRKDIMKVAIEARYTQDLKFKETILELKRRNKVLFHFERTGTYWGGSRPIKVDPDKRVWVGENVLGKLMMNVK